MALDGPGFVRAVMAALGVTSPAELAEKMRWPRGTERLVAKWLAGTNSPSFAYIMEMIDKAGLLGVKAEAARPLTEGERATLEQRRAEIETLLRRLQELVGE